MSPRKQRRWIYRVRWDRRTQTWWVKWKRERGSIEQPFRTKAEAVAAAVKYARTQHAAGALTQVVVHNKNGKIGYEFTYGQDPERWVG